MPTSKTVLKRFDLVSGSQQPRPDHVGSQSQPLRPEHVGSSGLCSETTSTAAVSVDSDCSSASRMELDIAEFHTESSSATTGVGSSNRTKSAVYTTAEPPKRKDIESARTVKVYRKYSSANDFNGVPSILVQYGCCKAKEPGGGVSRVAAVPRIADASFKGAVVEVDGEVDGKADQTTEKTQTKRVWQLEPAQFTVADHTYRDFSHYLERGGALVTHKKSTNNFPALLHRMLSCKENSHAIVWLPHGRALRIIDKERLIEEVIPKYYKCTNVHSFTRQFSRWGFKQLHQNGPDTGGYYHQCFLRGIPEITCLIRRPPPRLGMQLLPDKMNEPDFYFVSKYFPLPQKNSRKKILLQRVDTDSVKKVALRETLPTKDLTSKASSVKASQCARIPNKEAIEMISQVNRMINEAKAIHERAAYPGREAAVSSSKQTPVFVKQTPVFVNGNYLPTRDVSVLEKANWTYEQWVAMAHQRNS